MTMDEIVRRLESAEKKIAALEETLETIKQMNISEQMQEYIESRQRTVQLTGLLNSLSGQGLVDITEAERQIAQAQTQKSVVDKQIKDALATATNIDVDNTTPAELFTYEKCTAGAYGGVRITGYNGFDEAIVVIPKHILGKAVISIGEKAFFNGTMEEVILPNSIISISASAFRSCTKLRKINIPNKVVSIGDSAFFDCHKLEYIHLPASLRELGGSCFENSGITSINFPSSINEIPRSCCSGCKKLGEIRIEEGITEIKDWAFNATFFSYGPQNQLNAVVIPKTVSHIGKFAFSGRMNMNTAILGANTTAETGSFYGTLYVIPGSAMQRYARENKIQMKSLKEFPMK